MSVFRAGIYKMLLSRIANRKNLIRLLLKQSDLGLQLCAVCLCLLDRLQVFEILQHLPYIFSEQFVKMTVDEPERQSQLELLQDTFYKLGDLQVGYHYCQPSGINHIIVKVKMTVDEPERQSQLELLQDTLYKLGDLQVGYHYYISEQFVKMTVDEPERQSQLELLQDTLYKLGDLWYVIIIISLNSL